MDKTCEWIKAREEHPEDKIEFKNVLRKYSPNGPQKPGGDFADIVVVTDEGVSVWVSAD